MKKLGFIALLIFGSLIAQAQAPQNAEVVALRIELQSAQGQIRALSASLAQALIEGDSLRQENSKLKEDLKARTEKPSN